MSVETTGTLKLSKQSIGNQMTAGNDIIDRMTQAALALARERGWRSLSLGEIAARAEVPLLDAYEAVPSKTSLLSRLIDTTDRAVLSRGAATMTDTARDRLFDMLMRRFDSLHSRREGIIAILRDLPYDPPSLLCLLPRFARSIAWMLEAAGISSAGASGSLRLKGLALIYLNALRVWIEDDTPDMARTMAAVDKGLRRAEQLARSLPGVSRRSASGGPPPSVEPPAEGTPPAAAPST
jgi:AcrR family transcriptional regulator